MNIPFNRLIHMIRYKAEEYGIQVIVREERYTSRQSALDFDQLPNYGDKNANLVPSSGKRIGGLFIRSNGQKINADVNGCLNIGRKGSSSKTPVAKPDGTKMFCSAFLNDARMCCFFANTIVKY